MVNGKGTVDKHKNRVLINETVVPVLKLVFVRPKDLRYMQKQILIHE